MNNVLLIFIGGGIGSVMRYFVSWIVQTRFVSVFPLATLISNVLSCVIMGVTLFWFSQKATMSPNIKLFLIVGVCGGFSTFSTFSYETVELLRQGNIMLAAVNILLSVGVCTGILYYLLKSGTAI